MSTMNRLHNCTNRFQGPTRKVLCVCSAGLLRSPTVANWLHKEHGYNTRACGASEEYALIKLDQVLATWADEIVCVEPAIYDMIAPQLIEWKYVGLVNVLRLPDKFEWNSPELIEEIAKQYQHGDYYQYEGLQEPSLFD